MRRSTDQDKRPAWLEIRPAPHLGGGDSFAQMTRSMLIVVGLAGLAGVAVFGLMAAIWLAVAVGTAVVAEWAYVQLTGGRVTATYDHAALMGLLLGLTLPVGWVDDAGFHPLGWAVPLIGALVAIVVGKGLMGGMGNYLWHPALVGRAATELLYDQQMHPERWVVLGRNHLFAAVPKPVESIEYAGWRISQLPADANAWVLRRPVEWLRQLADGLPAGDESPLTVLIRDHLPPWEDLLLGGVGGGIGETCTIALIVGGLYLVYRGYVRWYQPMSVIVAAAVAAAVLPIRIGPAASFDWLPGLQTDAGLPIGAIYVLYHLTGGELMLAALLFATDTVASPCTARGQVIFGAAIGVLAIALRLYGPMPGSCYWAILIMNTFVGLIDRRTKRRVMGT